MWIICLPLKREEDIFTDYARPDWLIDAPVKNKLFVKKEYLSLPGKYDEVIYNLVHKKMGIEEERYENLLEKVKVLKKIDLSNVAEGNLFLEKAKRILELKE